MRRKLSLYVWENVLIDYSPGVMFALARDENEARELVAPGWLGRREAGKLTTLDMDLLQDPEVVTVPKGFSCWGGG